MDSALLWLWCSTFCNYDHERQALISLAGLQATVSFIDMCHCKADGSVQEYTAKRHELQAMSDLLSRSRAVSSAAERATRLLQGLLQAENAIALGHPTESISLPLKRKQRADDAADPFHSVVKKLIVS